MCRSAERLCLACLTLLGCSGGTMQRAPQEVLRTVRPVTAGDLVARAAALRQLRHLDQARTELLIAVSQDSGSAAGYRLLGLVEAKLGHRGAAVAALERSLALEGEHLCTRRELARLLLWRAWYRVLVLKQGRDARSDLARVRRLDPCLKDAAGRVLALLEQPSRPLLACPGIPAGLRPDRPRARGPCRIERPNRLVESLLQRELLAACSGARLALRLEAAGCSQQALDLWQALAAEAPSDPRWPLELGRLYMLRGEVTRAEQRFETHVYLSRDRAGALLAVARMLEALGQRAAAARYAVEALALATGLDRQLQALRILARNGTAEQVEQAARVVLARRWKVSPQRVRELVRAASRR